MVVKIYSCFRGLDLRVIKHEAEYYGITPLGMSISHTFSYLGEGQGKELDTYFPVLLSFP